VSFALHLLGIPLSLVGILLVPVCLAAASMPLFFFSTALFAGGYAVQFLGHAFDRSEPGEITQLRRLFRSKPSPVAVER
jgi:uncharacterized membrane protein YGL010W